MLKLTGEAEYTCMQQPRFNKTVCHINYLYLPLQLRAWYNFFLLFPTPWLSLSSPKWRHDSELLNSVISETAPVGRNYLTMKADWHTSREYKLNHASSCMISVLILGHNIIMAIIPWLFPSLAFFICRHNNSWNYKFRFHSGSLLKVSTT